MEKYQTAVPVPLFEERESVKFHHSLPQFVLDPAFTNAIFGAVMMLGAVLMLGAIAYGFFLAVIGGPLFGYGAFGWLMLQRRLVDFQPHTSTTKTGYEPIRVQETEDRSLRVGEADVPFYRQPKLIEHAQRKYTFSGKQLDKLETLYRSHGPAIRRDASREGPGWSETVGIGSSTFGLVVSILEGRGYVIKPQGSTNYEWTARGLRELLDIENPPTL